jgi:transposase
VIRCLVWFGRDGDDGLPGNAGAAVYDFRLDDHVPSDHLLRGIDGHVDFEGLGQTLKPFHSRIGRPSIDPELMIRMLIVGYCLGIRSERRLCEEVRRNLAHRWFCRLGLDGEAPDHSTFSKNRHGRFRDSDALRHLFESVVQRCMAEGLVSADGFAVDASLIGADANKQRSVPSRPAREYLATLDDAAFGAASPVTPKFVSLSDPAAPWTGAYKGHAFFAYGANYLIDADHGVIVDVEATRAIRQAEVGAAQTMLERTETRFGIKPAFLTADSAYGSADSLAWLGQRERHYPAHPGVRQVQPNRRRVLPRRLRLRRRTRSLHLPGGQRACPIPTHLRHSQKRRHGRRDKALSRQQIGLRHLQTQSPVLSERPRLQIPRDLHEDARDVARAHASTPEYAQACRRRKKIEMLFAHLKRILRLTRLRLRGPNGANDEFLLAATAQNLRRLARLRPMNMLPVMLAA